MNTTELASRATQMNQLADKHAGETPMSDEESDAFERTLSDADWLAGVTALLADKTNDLDAAAEIVNSNRDKCLAARHQLDFKAWEMAQYAAQEEGIV